MLKSVFLLTLIIIFTGCITKRNVVPSMQGSNIIKVESKNFIKGEMKKSFIGQIMLEEKKYFIKKEFLSTMSPVVAFDIRGPLGIHLYGNPSFKYEILGTTIIKNHKFNILAYENKKNKYHGRKMLIDDNNILYNKILNGKDNIEVMWDLNIYPRIVKFNNNLENNQIVLTNKPYINYKLFFSGIENNKIKLTYQEYASDNLTKTSFFHNLSYPRKIDIIHFRNIRIKIEDIKDNQLTFSVI